MYAWGKKGKMLVFTGVYVCVKAKLTLVSFFSLFFLHLSLSTDSVIMKVIVTTSFRRVAIEPISPLNFYTNSFFWDVPLPISHRQWVNIRLKLSLEYYVDKSCQTLLVGCNSSSSSLHSGRVNITRAKVCRLLKNEFPIQQLRLFCANFSTSSSDHQTARARVVYILSSWDGLHI